MRRNIVISRTLLPFDSLKLGTFVLNIDEPKSHCDPPSELNPESITEQSAVEHDEKFKESLQTTVDHGFASMLTSLASKSHTTHTEVDIKIEADRVTSYELRQPDLWFEQAVANAEIRRRIELANRQGCDVYVVVGYFTVHDAKVSGKYAGIAGSKTRLGLPVSAILGALGYEQPTKPENPSIENEWKSGDCSQREYIARGERIFAVQYRKIQYKWFTARDLDGASLEKSTQWTVYWGIRGHHDDNDSNILQVNLQQTLTVAGVEEFHLPETQDYFFL